MEPADFVFNQVYRGALAAGCSERSAQQAAVVALDKYKKNKFYGKVSILIEDSIKTAKKTK